MNRDNKLVCTFFTKIGACRHGDKCSRKHIKPSRSDTILLANLYQNPKMNNNGSNMTPEQIQDNFDHFYKDIFLHFMKIGQIRSMVVCENENYHLNGNVYVRFANTEIAYSAVLQLNQEWYGGRPVHCELSPVESFQDANCRAYDNDTCSRGDHCNYMHLIRPSTTLKNDLMKVQDKYMLEKKLDVLRQQFSESKTHVSKPSVSESTQSMINVSSTATPEALERLFSTS